MRGAIKNATVDIHPEPAEVASHFSRASAEEQAAILNEIARTFGLWTNPDRARQMVHISRSLSPASVNFMRALVVVAEHAT